MEFSDNERIQLKKAYVRLEGWVSRNHYKGWDPYDVLTSPFPFRKLGKWPPIIAIQLHKRNPINLRKLLGIPKMWNPKALGLFLQAYSLLPQNNENRQKCRWLFDKLMELPSPHYAGMGWGYPFPWASPEKFLPQWSPTAVVSGFVAQGIEAYFRAYGDPRALDALHQVCVFISQCLHHTVRDNFYAISYSTLKPDFCYNASLLAAQTYALTYAHTGQQAYADISRSAMHTVLERQRNDGSWNYSEDLVSGRQRVQIDFHQGFVLDSILAISQALGDDFPESVEKALQNGFEFYRENLFEPSGRARWRYPHAYPADIHHQAQGILSAVRYYNYCGSRRAEALAKSVLLYTIDNFQNPRGYFYYRKHKSFTDRTTYMRWGNAWMLLALAQVLAAR